MTIEELFGEPIFAYTRADAIRDGELVDVSATAKEAGINYPVAMTRAAWAEAVSLSDGTPGQDEAGRLWDVLWMLKYHAQRTKGDTLEYQLLIAGKGVKRLKSQVHGGDNLEPVITIMLPGED